MELESYRKHIQYRYARKTWSDLSTAQQEAWETVNRRATMYTKGAFYLLCAEFALFAAVGISILTVKPPPPRHELKIELSLQTGRNPCITSVKTQLKDGLKGLNS